MSINVPVVALALVGLLLAIAGIFTERSLYLILGGVVIILFAWVLQEMTRRRP